MWCAVAVCLPAASVTSLEGVLREALRRCTALPQRLSLDLVQEEVLGDGTCLVDGALRSLAARPYVREIARSLIRWRDQRAFPFDDRPTPPDVTQIGDNYAGLTDDVIFLTTRPTEQLALSLLERLGPWGVLALLGCRRTAGTIQAAPPSAHALVVAFDAPHSAASASRLTVGARALSKHWQRSASRYWGDEAQLKGNDEAKNARAKHVLLRLLRDACWINLHGGVGDHEHVCELRVPSGYGARWSADGSRFRGFIEPQAWDLQRRQERAPAKSAAGAAPTAAIAFAFAAVAAESVSGAGAPPSARRADGSSSVPSLDRLVCELQLDRAISEGPPVDADSAPVRLVTIAGYASLMDEDSARTTTPSLSGFRYAVIRGYCRCFTLVSIINVRRGKAYGRRLATAAARPRDDGSTLRVCLFEVPLDELPGLLSRERRLRVSCAPYEACDAAAASDASSGRGAVSTAGGGGKRVAGLAVGSERVAHSAASGGRVAGWTVLFSEYSDEEYREGRLRGDPALYQLEVGQYYQGRLYRTDLLPVPSYVLLCARAHQRAGAAALTNFLDGSFLGDGTPLRSYLEGELRMYDARTCRAAGLEAGPVGGATPGCEVYSDEEYAELGRLLAITATEGQCQ